MLRGGQRFFVKARAGTVRWSFEAAGANSVRTWGADNLEPLLDPRPEAGMTVTVASGSGRSGRDQLQDAGQVPNSWNTRSRSRRALQEYIRPVLMWGIGTR